jgi:hypothetical protein
MSLEAQTKVYREIGQANPDLINWLDLRDQLYSVTDPEGKERVFVDNDIPRDSDITPLIVDETVGFALFDNQGEYVNSYETLNAAIKAQQSARIVVSTEVDLDGSEA